MTSQPTHGHVGPLRVISEASGGNLVVIPYTSELNFLGTDHVTIHSTDGRGPGFDTSLTVNVDAIPITWAVTIDGYALLPAPAPAVDQARNALHTAAVRLAKRAGNTLVYTPRGALDTTARAPALGVVCTLVCSVTASMSLQSGHMHQSTPRGLTALAVSPGTAGKVGLHFTRRQKTSLAHTGHGNAVFHLTVRDAGTQATSFNVRVAIQARRRHPHPR